MFSAQNGLNYRRYKKGVITKDEFKNRTKKGAVAQVGGITGSASGMFAGFFAGQVLIPIPVVGALVGCLVGGFAGGMVGAKTSVRVYEKIEARIALNVEKRKAQLEAGKFEDELEDLPTYEEALAILGVRDTDNFDYIFLEYQMLL